MENLLHSKRIRRKFKYVYYCYPCHFDQPFVNWDSWPDIIVTYLPYIPDVDFFKNVKKDSVIIFDDNYEQVIKSAAVAQALKIHSRRGFSVILITQMYFDQGPYARVIRNQLNAVVLFRNFGDNSINKRVASQLGALEQFNEAEKATKNIKFDPVVILSPEIVELNVMRVQTNYLANNYSFCYG